MKGLWFGVVLIGSMMLIAACDTKEIDVMTSNSPSADRGPPAIIAPVSIDGIVYAQYFGRESEDGQVGGLLAAHDAARQLLWILKVYDNVRDPRLEGDVQDVFFREMTLEPDGRLRIVNESGNTFLVDVKTRTVTALPKPSPAEGGRKILRPTPRS